MAGLIHCYPCRAVVYSLYLNVRSYKKGLVDVDFDGARSVRFGLGDTELQHAVLYAGFNLGSIDIYR